MEPRRAHMLLATMLGLFMGSVASSGQADQLKFKLRDGYQVIARGAIAGLDEINLAIDTGTIPSIVDWRIAKKLRLDIRESENVAFGHKSRGARTILPDVRLGPIRADSLIAGVGDLSFLGCCVDAIIGVDVLTRRSFSIDYDQRLLTFGPLVASDRSVPLEVIPPFLIVRARARWPADSPRRRFGKQRPRPVREARARQTAEPSGSRPKAPVSYFRHVPASTCVVATARCRRIEH